MSDVMTHPGSIMNPTVQAPNRRRATIRLIHWQPWSCTPQCVMRNHVQVSANFSGCFIGNFGGLQQVPQKGACWAPLAQQVVSSALPLPPHLHLLVCLGSRSMASLCLCEGTKDGCWPVSKWLTTNKKSLFLPQLFYSNITKA